MPRHPNHHSLRGNSRRAPGSSSNSHLRNLGLTRRVGERAGHFSFDTLHCAGANADLAGCRDDAHAGPQQLADAIFDGSEHLAG